VSAIADARLVVYVERATQQLGGAMIGVTEFLGTSGGYRYLRVRVDDRTSRKHVIALVGHELQHAREIGEDPTVIDQAGVEALYRRIGDLSVDGYDSEAARAMGAIVFAELWAAPSSSASPAQVTRN
jgi:hypothetical protein